MERITDCCTTLMPFEKARCRRSKFSALRDACYSITSSAVANSVSGMVRPSALAVLRLMTNSNFGLLPIEWVKTS